ncbi:unnamed protein product [Trifolium pratense]|uniref:Uncharacterized protein n=1 Tax=Trifolium pratense TaxID=57577 RepID=A0ACB0I9C8_TRIPR|nr:unnamed protein product [Trifolium pratense]
MYVQIFHFDVHEDVRTIADATIEKDESHAGKVVEYEKNKHIFLLQDGSPPKLAPERIESQTSRGAHSQVPCQYQCTMGSQWTGACVMGFGDLINLPQVKAGNQEEVIHTGWICQRF